MRWQELRSPELARCAEEDWLAVLPVGSLEQHGAHLPVDTDSHIVTAVAEQAAERAERTLVLPTLTYGLSPHHMGAGGTVTLSHDTFCAVVRDVVGAVAAQGFRRMVILNGHGGNDAALKGIVVGLQGALALRLLTITYWYLIPEETVAAVREGGVGSMGHAGELETSVQLHLRPGRVAMDAAVAAPIRPRLPHLTEDLFRPGAAQMMDGLRESRGPFVWGDATLARADKGERLFEAAVAHTADYLRAFRTLD